MRWLFVSLCLLCSPAFGQVAMPDVNEPYKPIVAGCDCIAPVGGSIQFIWRASGSVSYLQCGDKLHIWAPPGAHWVEVTTITQTFKEVVVLIPDPAAPLDISKAKTEKLKISTSIDVARYTKDFTVGVSPTPVPGPGPAPPPQPGPAPGPTPDGLAGEVQKWLKAVPSANYSKEKANQIADNYESVAAQAVATSGWNLAAFTQKTKELNQQKFTTAEMAAWADPFFRPLATKQAELFQQRSLTPSDVKGIATLWRDTAAAIRTAAF